MITQAQVQAKLLMERARYGDEPPKSIYCGRCRKRHSYMLLECLGKFFESARHNLGELWLTQSSQGDGRRRAPGTEPRLSFTLLDKTEVALSYMQIRACFPWEDQGAAARALLGDQLRASEEILLAIEERTHTIQVTERGKRIALQTPAGRWEYALSEHAAISAVLWGWVRGHGITLARGDRDSGRSRVNHPSRVVAYDLDAALVFDWHYKLYRRGQAPLDVFDSWGGDVSEERRSSRGHGLDWAFARAYLQAFWAAYKAGMDVDVPANLKRLERAVQGRGMGALWRTYKDVQAVGAAFGEAYRKASPTPELEYEKEERIL